MGDAGSSTSLFCLFCFLIFQCCVNCLWPCESLSCPKRCHGLLQQQLRSMVLASWWGRGKGVLLLCSPGQICPPLLGQAAETSWEPKPNLETQDSQRALHHGNYLCEVRASNRQPPTVGPLESSELHQAPCSLWGAAYRTVKRADKNTLI